MHQKAFLEMIEPFKPGLFGFAYRMLRSREDARDVMQDLLMKLWMNRNSLETNGNIKTYCFTALYHQCVDKLRQRNRFHPVQSDVLLDVEDRRRVDQSVENLDLVLQVKRSMDQLPEKQKTVLELRDFQGFEYEEIAGMLGMTVNAVRVAVARSRAAISEKMKEEIDYGR